VIYERFVIPMAQFKVYEILYQSFRLPDICFLANNVHIWFVVDTIAQQLLLHAAQYASNHVLTFRTNFKLKACNKTQNDGPRNFVTA
jgi:hypothetical protein